MTTTETGLQYFVIKAGNGRSPLLTDVVKVNYTGMFLDGKRFETTEGRVRLNFRSTASFRAGPRQCKR